MNSKNQPVYLSTYLEPLNSLLSRDDITDIYINEPGEVWIETIGGNIERQTKEILSQKNLIRLAQQVAAYSHQGINRENPLLAATLPDGSRIQIVISPASKTSCVIAIRKHAVKTVKLADYLENDVFKNSIIDNRVGTNEVDKQLLEAHSKRDFATMLSTAVKAKKNILISGGTSTGKTTFLNSLISEIPVSERLILIEDTPELKTSHENSVGLIAVRDNLGEAIINTNDLLTASLRLRPDRIIVGELRGTEAFTFLRAINTGHPGSMTTIHADSPQHAIEQLVLLVLQSGTQLTRADIIEYVSRTVDLYVQLKRENGKRFISEIVLNSEKLTQI